MLLHAISPYTEEPAVRSNAGGERYIVDVAGYIPKQTQLQNLIKSGEQLIEYQKEVYKNLELSPPDEAFYDPTTRKDYDVFDAYNDLYYVRDQLKASELEKQKREEFHAKQAAAEAAASTSEARVVSEESQKTETAGA